MSLKVRQPTPPVLPSLEPGEGQVGLPPTPPPPGGRIMPAEPTRVTLSARPRSRTIRVKVERGFALDVKRGSPADVNRGALDSGTPVKTPAGIVGFINKVLPGSPGTRLKDALKKFIGEPLEKIWDAISPLAKALWKQLQRDARWVLDRIAELNGIPLEEFRRLARQAGVDLSNLSDEELAALEEMARRRAHLGPDDLTGRPQGFRPNLGLLALIAGGIWLLGRAK